MGYRHVSSSGDDHTAPSGRGASHSGASSSNSIQELCKVRSASNRSLYVPAGTSRSEINTALELPVYAIKLIA